MLNTRDSMREGTNEWTYTTTKHITTLLLHSRVKNDVFHSRRARKEMFLMIEDQIRKGIWIRVRPCPSSHTSKFQDFSATPRHHRTSLAKQNNIAPTDSRTRHGTRGKALCSSWCVRASLSNIFDKCDVNNGALLSKEGKNTCTYTCTSYLKLRRTLSSFHVKMKTNVVILNKN